MQQRVAAAAAVVAAAGLGTIGTDPDSAWYRGLRKPPFQPPKLAFPIVWTGLYAVIGAASGQAVSKLAAAGHSVEQQALVSSYATNLALNTGWSWLFFTAHRPLIATVECAVLTASSIDLTRRIGRADGPAGVALAVYPAWCAFATALSGGVAWLNRRRA